jgi:hypothetical protein
MLRAGRPSDQNFHLDDPLYYRIEREDELDGARLDPQKIRAAFDVSVNWAKYSKPWDVIFDHPFAGFARFLVRDIRVDLPRDTSPEHQYQTRNSHSYGPSHEPEDSNYAHSSIIVTKNGQRVVKSAQISSTARREFRQLLADRAEVLLRPGR